MNTLVSRDAGDRGPSPRSGGSESSMLRSFLCPDPSLLARPCPPPDDTFAAFWIARCAPVMDMVSSEYCSLSSRILALWRRVSVSMAVCSVPSRSRARASTRCQCKSWSSCVSCSARIVPFSAASLVFALSSSATSPRSFSSSSLCSRSTRLYGSTYCARASTAPIEPPASFFAFAYSERRLQLVASSVRYSSDRIDVAGSIRVPLDTISASSRKMISPCCWVAAAMDLRRVSRPCSRCTSAHTLRCSR
mmetsp:Transcript_21327/g.55667  ORF Transcript_21327/g.55667 Transcript_21327/m.55667 type:complete len:249 (-) Transcript_21327:997-1743(-)